MTAEPCGTTTTTMLFRRGTAQVAMSTETRTKPARSVFGVCPRTRHWVAASAVALFSGGMVILATMDVPLTGDEIWHWPVVLLFGRGLPTIEALASYHAGPGPLPYIIWGNLHAMGMGLGLLRATSLVFLGFAVVGLVKVARELRASSVAILVAFILVQPYILTNAFLLMTDSLALALAVWSLYWILAGIRTGETKYWAWAGFAVASVLYTRLPYVSIPIGLGLAALTTQTHQRQALSAAMLSIAAVGPLIALWGGFTALTMQGTHHLTIDPRSINHLLAWLGFFYWPYVLTRIRYDSTRPRLLWILPIIAIGCLTRWFMPFEQHRTAAAGVIDRLVILSGDVGPGWLPHVFYFLLWGMGLLTVVYTAFRSWPVPKRRVILLMALCAAALPALHSFGWWERHAIPAYLFVGILAWSEPMKRKWIPIAWLSLLAALAIAHVLHVVVYLG